MIPKMKKLTWKNLVEALQEAVRISVMVLFLVAGANVFSYFLALSTIPMQVAEWAGSLEVSPYVIHTVVIIMYMFLGCFLDAISMMVLTMPVIYPVILALGFDPIWFGVIAVLMMEAGLITPPMGLNIFTVAGVAKGVPVVHSNLDKGLDDYPDNSFDYVILSQTIQQVHRPDRTLKEMLRVGKVGIVGLLNFGYWRVRHYLAVRGEMPKSKAVPYEWYDTPNIHLSTINDFRRLCQNAGYEIVKQINVVNRKRGQFLPNIIPNSFAELAVFVIETK